MVVRSHVCLKTREYKEMYKTKKNGVGKYVYGYFAEEVSRNTDAVKR